MVIKARTRIVLMFILIALLILFACVEEPRDTPNSPTNIEIDTIS